MAVTNKETILQKLNGIIGENSSDEALGLIEDITDTFSDYDTRLSDQTDYKKKFEENDASWRKKYRERFMSGSSENPDSGTEPPKQLRYEDLFK